MATHTVDYRSTVFEHPTLTRIHGEPTFEGIRQLHKEVMVNAQTVHSDLGGGAHGHLGLTLSPRRYALISNAPYNRPTHPGQLIIPAGTTQHMARTIRDQHTERLRLFREVTGVENALKQQIVAAVEPQYLEAIRNQVTGKLAGSVYEVIRHLFHVYGQVTPQALYDQEQKVQQMVYDPQHPIDGVFTAIDDLMTFAEAAQTPYTQPQSINLAYRILNRTGLFQRWIIIWNEKPQVQKTWTNFKLHFREAHQQLKETTNLQAQNSPYHANALREIVEELKAEIQATHQINSAMDSDHQPPSTTSISEGSTDSSISALQSEVASLKDYIHNIQQTYQPPPPPPMYPPPNFWNIPYAMPPQHLQNYMQQVSPYVPSVQNTQTGQQNNTRKKRVYYCHTHGACFHPGSKCRNKGPNHQDNATFSNRMGGSTKNVRLNRDNNNELNT